MFAITFCPAPSQVAYFFGYCQGDLCILCRNLLASLLECLASNEWHIIFLNGIFFNYGIETNTEEPVALQLSMVDLGEIVIR